MFECLDVSRYCIMMIVVIIVLKSLISYHLQVKNHCLSWLPVQKECLTIPDVEIVHFKTILVWRENSGPSKCHYHFVLVQVPRPELCEPVQVWIENSGCSKCDYHIVLVPVPRVEHYEPVQVWRENSGYSKCEENFDQLKCRTSTLDQFKLLGHFKCG